MGGGNGDADGGWWGQIAQTVKNTDGSDILHLALLGERGEVDGWKLGALCGLGLFAVGGRGHVTDVSPALALHLPQTVKLFFLVSTSSLSRFGKADTDEPAATTEQTPQLTASARPAPSPA